MKKIALLLSFIIILSGCTKMPEFSKDFFAMDTYMSIKTYGKNAENAAENAMNIIKSIDKSLSRHSSENEIFMLNNYGEKPTKVSQETYNVISMAYDFAKKTSGAYDPTIAPITDLWAIGTKDAKVPTDFEINNALKSVGYENIKLLGNNTVLLLNGAKLDFGGIGKGVAADKAYESIKKDGINKSLIALAGNIYAMGEKEKNKPWKIGIADPDDSKKSIATINMTNKTAVTTGAYERFFEKDGVKYHHVFDSKTGKPANSDLLSVTIISDNSTLADAYSTALFVMGYEKAMQYYKQNNDFEAVFIKKDNTIVATQGITENLEITSDKYIKG